MALPNVNLFYASIKCKPKIYYDEVIQKSYYYHFAEIEDLVRKVVDFCTAKDVSVHCVSVTYRDPKIFYLNFWTLRDMDLTEIRKEVKEIVTEWMDKRRKAYYSQKDILFVVQLKFDVFKNAEQRSTETKTERTEK